MPSGALPRYSLYLRLLRLSLIAGAVYDFVLAALLAFAPDLPAQLLGVPPPGEDFYLWLIAVIVAMLGAFYLLAAYDPVAYRGNVAVAIAGRAAAGVVLGMAARRSGLAGLYPLAAADLLFAAAHAGFWWPVRK
jgi:hypothetical protein